MDINLYNTAERKTVPFKPLTVGQVNIYNCGPTVYDYAHIGNLRAFTMADIIRRTFEYNGYKVNQVMNITDVGHLTNDEDEGEDKIELGAKRDNKSPLEIAKFYTDQFLKDSKQLNLLEPLARPRATEFIKQMIEMVEILVAKDYAYVTKTAVYFDVLKFPGYGALSGQKLAEKKTGVRKEVVIDDGKRNPQDFRLWQLDQPNHLLKWDSPWGEGFPGWHIECSAMSKFYLGETLDIHTGGIDHIAVHHTNEIAQSEAANGKKYSNYWYHNEFILVDGIKMSKSKNNFYNLADIIKKDYTALDLRYLFFTVHFRQMQNFTWQALSASKSALQRLMREVKQLKLETSTTEISQNWQTKFKDTINNDFNMPEALAIVWELLKSTESSEIKLGTILSFDQILGFNLAELKFAQLTNTENMEIESLIKARLDAKLKKDWQEADRIRQSLLASYNVEIKDSGNETTWSVRM